MQFNSLSFLIFFVLVLLFHYSAAPWRAKKAVLLGASYLFYAMWNPPFVLLLLFSTIVDWKVAAAMARQSSPQRRKALLVVSLCANLGMLGFFKYGGFLLQNFELLASSLGVQWQSPGWDILLPMGISFYTFQTLSYTIDVYRGDLKPWHSWLDYALFVSFFPQLVAGPIVRASVFLPQCLTLRRATGAAFSLGLALLTLGLFEKTVLADDIFAPIADQAFSVTQTASFASAWLGSMAFAGQIFCDFAGYSSAAIGIAMCLGFAIPDNFRMPYAAVGFSDFWRRWHISLSQWLRDYLYLSLGGNRKGFTSTQVNLMLTMLLGGLWHGASWNFVVWGGLHGLYLMLERLWRSSPLFGPASRMIFAPLVGAVVTFLLVCVAWVFFRASDFGQSLQMVSAMLGFGGDEASGLTWGSDQKLALFSILALVIVQALMRHLDVREWFSAIDWRIRALLLSAMLVAIVLSPGNDRAFIYFQF